MFKQLTNTEYINLTGFDKYILRKLNHLEFLVLNYQPRKRNKVVGKK